MKGLGRIRIFIFLILSIVTATSAKGSNLTIVASGSLDEGRPIGFEAQGASGSDSFKWDFGDGSPTLTGVALGKTHHTYADEGTYTVSVTSTDSHGSVASVSTQVQIKNVAPRIVDLQAPADVKIGKSATFLSKVQDPGTKDVLTYEWDFGDGTSSSSGIDLRNPKHAFQKQGVFVVSLTVSDGDGGSVSRTIIVPVEQWFDVQRKGQISGGFTTTTPTPPGFMLISSKTSAEVSPGYCAVTILIGAEKDVLILGGQVPAPFRTGSYPVRHYQSKSQVGLTAQDRISCDLPGVDCSGGLPVGQATGGNITITQVSPKEIRGSFSISTQINYSLSGAFVAAPSAVFGMPISVEEGTCIRTGDLQVTDFSWKSLDHPQNSRFQQNTLVDYESPEIQLVLSEDVDLDSFFSGFVVEYQRPDGQFEEVPGLLLGVDDHTVSWSPLEDLMDGVIYRATVKHGQDGVRGEDGETMKAPFVWQFETLLNLGEDRNGIAATLYQVAADASLVPGKQTLTRVYVNWTEKKEVHPDAQTKSATVEVSVKDDKKQELYAKKTVNVKRPDLYSKDEIKHGLSSINFFNWEPKGSESSPLKVEVEQRTQIAATPKTFTGRENFQFYKRSKNLLVDYFILNFEGIPPALTKAVTIQGHALAHRAEPYVTQNFPVPDTEIRYRGPVTMTFPDLPVFTKTVQGHEVRIFGIPGVAEKAVDDWVMEHFYDQVKSKSNADIILVISPKLQPTLAGFTYRSYPPLSAGAGIPRLVAAFLPDGAGVATIAHEFGHSFDLRHTTTGPCSIAGMTTPRLQNCIQSNLSDPVEGYRLDKAGQFGWNKSATEGNAEAQNTPGTVVSLMNEIALPEGLGFILPSDYEQLQKAYLLNPPKAASGNLMPAPSPLQIAWESKLTLKANDLAPFVSSSMLASALFPTSSDDEIAKLDGSFSVRGYIADNGSAAFIDSILPDPREARDSKDGSFEAILTDPAGVQLATIRFDSRPAERLTLHPFPGNGVSFEVLVPRMEGTHRIEIRRTGGKLLAERRSSPSQPAVRFLAPSAGAQISGKTTITWEGSDQDGDSLRYDLYYATDEKNWTPILIGSQKTSFTVDTEDLAGGPATYFKLVASDGFHANEATLPVDLAGSMPAPLLLQGGEDVDVQATLTLLFRSPLVLQKGQSDPVYIKTSEGEDVPVSIQSDEQGGRLWITPSKPLNPNMDYSLHLKSGLQDRFGRRLDDELTWTFRTGEAPRKSSIPQTEPLLMPDSTVESKEISPEPVPEKSVPPPVESHYLKVTVGAPMNLHYEMGLSDMTVTALCEENRITAVSFQTLAPDTPGMTNLMLKPVNTIRLDSIGSFPLDMLNLAYQPEGAIIFTMTMGTGNLTLDENKTGLNGNISLKGSFAGTINDSSTGQSSPIQGRFDVSTNCVRGRH